MSEGVITVEDTTIGEQVIVGRRVTYCSVEGAIAGHGNAAYSCAPVPCLLRRLLHPEERLTLYNQQN